jgi:hypothetical protein
MWRKTETEKIKPAEHLELAPFVCSSISVIITRTSVKDSTYLF